MPKQEKRNKTEYNFKKLRNNNQINRLNRRLTQLEKSIRDNSKSKEKEYSKPHFFERFGTVSDILIVIFSLLTTVATLLIFNKSIDAANASVRSADAADSTFKQQKRTDSLNRIADSIKDYNDSIKFEITFNLNKKSVDSSIAISKASLEAQINQFAIINEPYLQASIDTIYADTARKTIYLTISFKNIGNHPVRIKQFGITNLIQSKIPTFKENFEKGILIDWSNPGEHFVTKDMPFKEPISLISPLGFPSAFKNRTAYMYIAGEVLYINLITKATKKYQFQIRTSPFVKDLNELFYNSNTP